MEGLFYERVHALECEFAEKFKPLFEKVSVKLFLYETAKLSLHSSGHKLNNLSKFILPFAIHIQLSTSFVSVIISSLFSLTN